MTLALDQGPRFPWTGAGALPDPEGPRVTRRPSPTTRSRCIRRRPSIRPPASRWPPPRTTWTHVFGREMVVAGAERPEVVAITAAMCGPTGLVPFGDRVPGPGVRCRDRRAARPDLRRRAGDGRYAPGGRGLRDLPEPGLRPVADGLRVAPARRHRGARPGRGDRRGRAQPPRHVGHVAGRNGSRAPVGRAAGRRHPGRGTCRGAGRLRRPDHAAVPQGCGAGLRAGRPAVPPAPARRAASGDRHRGRRITAGVDILAEPAAGQDRDVLLVAVGAFGGLAVEAADKLAAQGIGVTVVDPRWVLPVPAEIECLAASTGWW